MDALTLLEQAAQAGVTLRVEGDRLVVRGPRRAEVLARQILEHKPEVVAALSSRSVATTQESVPDAGHGDHPGRTRCASCGELDFHRPHAGGAWRCARCRPYDLPGTEVEWWPRVGLMVPFEARAVLADATSAACHCSGGTSRWRLRSGGPWTCPRCHPPSVWPEAIETISEAAP